MYELKKFYIDKIKSKIKIKNYKKIKINKKISTKDLVLIMVPRAGIEPATRGFSVLCSTD